MEFSLVIKEGMTVKIGAIFRSSQKHVNSGGLKALVGKKGSRGLSKTYTA